MYRGHKDKANVEINYLGGVVTDAEKCDAEVQSHIGIVIHSFQKLRKILR